MAKKKIEKHKGKANGFMLDPPKFDTCQWTFNGKTVAMFGMLGTEPTLMIWQTTDKQTQTITKQIYPKAKLERLPHAGVKV